MILEETGIGYIMQEDDEAMAKVSIIMPVYNEEQYLEQCLDSICGQTFKNGDYLRGRWFDRRNAGDIE